MHPFALSDEQIQQVSGGNVDENGVWSCDLDIPTLGEPVLTLDLGETGGEFIAP